jgi:hypothetical protein
LYQSPQQTNIDDESLATNSKRLNKAVDKTKNTILSQLKSNLNSLRHTLKKFDISNSGSVNLQEFQSSLIKSGLHSSKSSLKDLFVSLADENNDLQSSLGNSQGKSLSIESFISDLCEQSQVTQLNEPTNGPSSKNLKLAEELRVVSKITNAADKNYDCFKLYEDISSSSSQSKTTKTDKSSLNTSQFKQALVRLGADINDRELNHLNNRIEKVINISMNEKENENSYDPCKIQEICRNEIESKDKANYQSRSNLLQNNSRYTNTFKSSAGWIDGIPHSEHVHLFESPSYIRNEQRDRRLQRHLRSSVDLISGAYMDNTKDVDDKGCTLKSKISTAKLAQSLQLGCEDKSILEKKLGTISNLDNLCELSGLKVGYKDNKQNKTGKTR